LAILEETRRKSTALLLPGGKPRRSENDDKILRKKKAALSTRGEGSLPTGSRRQSRSVMTGNNGKKQFIKPQKKDMASGRRRKVGFHPPGGQRYARREDPPGRGGREGRSRRSGRREKKADAVAFFMANE